MISKTKLYVTAEYRVGGVLVNITGLRNRKSFRLCFMINSTLVFLQGLSPKSSLLFRRIYILLRAVVRLWKLGLIS